MSDSWYKYGGYDLMIYEQPDYTYWGTCRELGIRVRENTLEKLKESFQNELSKAEYKVYLCWRCDQEEYYCTESDRYVVESLQEHLPKLAERIKEIERKNTIEIVEITRL